jgi:hypothetical protein
MMTPAALMKTKVLAPATFAALKLCGAIDIGLEEGLAGSGKPEKRGGMHDRIDRLQRQWLATLQISINGDSTHSLIFG